ncbi:MAG: hypothetical protein V3V33_15595 [Candidatus Lokiarchaeia archaeon]
MHEKYNRILVLELILVVTYTVMILFYSDYFFPTFFILSLVCILFIPGYNLLNLIKPNLDKFLKIGYSTVISLALENILFFLIYFFFYDSFFFSTGLNYFYNNSFIIIVIQLISIALILLNFVINKKRIKRNNKVNNNISRYISNSDLIDILIFITYIFFLIVLVISASYGGLPSREFIDLYHEHRTLLAFFYHLPLFFYVFLLIVIFLLISLILFTKNKFLIIISICLFFYVLWILPYINLSNYFSADSYNLSLTLYKIKNNENSFILTPFKYTTSIFSSIILINATKLGIDFTLWFIYPLILFPLPFLFYGIFKTFSTTNKNLTIITFFAMLTPLFLKFAHSASTGPIGTYIFFILIFEFYGFINLENGKSKRGGYIVFIIFLYFFLTITHFEECIYFLIIVILYSNYHLFVNYKGFESISLRRKSQKKEIKTCILLFYLLAIILYISQEIITYWSFYIRGFLGNNIISRTLIYIYENIGLVELFFFSEVKINIAFILIITLIVMIFYLIISLIYLHFFKFLRRFQKVTVNFLSKNLKGVKKTFFLKKISPYLAVVIVYISLLFLNEFYIQFLDFHNLFVFIEIFLSFGIILFNIFLFISGIKYYKIENKKQNYFLLAMLSTSIIFLAFFITGNVLLFSSTFQNKFLTYFTFFNLIIIQNTYFPTLINKRKVILFLVILILAWLGIFYSFKKLSWG